MHIHAKIEKENNELKPSRVVHACNRSTWGQRPEHYEIETSLGYTVSSAPAWDMQ